MPYAKALAAIWELAISGFRIVNACVRTLVASHDIHIPEFVLKMQNGEQEGILNREVFTKPLGNIQKALLDTDHEKAHKEWHQTALSYIIEATGDEKLKSAFEGERIIRGGVPEFQIIPWSVRATQWNGTIIDTVQGKAVTRLAKRFHECQKNLERCTEEYEENEDISQRDYEHVERTWANACKFGDLYVDSEKHLGFFFHESPSSFQLKFLLELTTKEINKHMADVMHARIRKWQEHMLDDMKDNHSQATFRWI